MARHWKPQPIAVPTVDPELPKLDGLTRAGEALRFAVLSVELWISPRGTLREWCKVNGKISSILLIPAMLVVPLVSFILWHIAMWMGYLVGITGNLIVLPLAVLLAITVIAAVVTLLRAIFGK